MSLNPDVGSFCTGYGGLDQAVESVFGGRLVWYSEIESGPIKVLEHRYPDVPNIGDLTKADWSAVSRPTIVTGGYPCQPFSIAGKKKGTNDERHIWPFIAEGLRVLRPRIIVLENVANHVNIGLRDVLGDLAAMGYHAAWGVFRASEAGAPHQRARVYIVAIDGDTTGFGRDAAPLEGERREPAGQVGRSDFIVAPDSDSTGLAFGRSVGSDARPELPTAERGRGKDVPNGDSLREQSECFPRGSSPAVIGRDSGESFDWQEYTDAVRRWESVLGRPAPYPSAVGPRGGKKVNPAFTEWLMGLPEGWITDVPGLTMNEQIKLCGNGVVPQQAELAIRSLWQTLTTERQ